MENKAKKPGWRLNVFDMIIIAVIVLAAAALLLVWRLSGAGGNDEPIYTKTVTYTIELKGMLSGTAEHIKAGDVILDSIKKFEMGTVVSVDIQPTTISVANRETGDTVLSVVPGKETAVIVLECEATDSASEITAASGYLIRVGKEIHAAGPGYAGLGYIIGIEREDIEQ
jgi:hypothetical protein